MSAVYPINLPRQQLPQPTDRLSDGFLHAQPAPVGLWMPSKLAQAAADFTPLPQKHFGALNGGITTAPGGFGTLGQRWALNGSSQNIPLTSSASIQIQLPFTFWAVVTLSSSGSYPAIYSFASSVSFSSTLFFGCNASGGAFSAEIGGTKILNVFAFSPGTPTFVAGSIGASSQLMAMGKNGAPLQTSSAANAIGALTYSGAPYVGSFGPSGGYWPGSISAVALHRGAFSIGQLTLLYNCLFTGQPFPLFAPQVSELAFGSAAATSATGAGGLIATSSLFASSLFSAMVGIASSLSTIASSLYGAAAGVQAAGSGFVQSNFSGGIGGLSSAALQSVLTNLANGSAATQSIASPQVLSNLIAAIAGTRGTQSTVASSIISLLARLQAVSEQSTAIVAQGMASLSAGGNARALNNLIALNEELASAAAFVASSMYGAASSVEGPASALVLVNLLSVAQRVQALSQQLANSLSAMSAGSGARATVIANNLYRASGGCGAFATVSAILDAAICELASIRPSYASSATLRAMYESAAGVRPSYAARADIDGC